MSKRKGGEKMAEGKDKRVHERYNYEAPIKFKYYDSLTYSTARMFNYSQSGMYFESKDNIKPESIIYITMENYSSGARGPEAYEGFHANVMWNKEYQSSDSKYYGTGVEYYE